MSIELEGLKEFSLEVASVKDIQIESIRYLYLTTGFTVEYISKLLGISSRTVFRDLRKIVNRVGLEKRGRDDIVRENLRLRKLLETRPSESLINKNLK